MSFKITQYNSIPYAYKKHSYRIYKPKIGDHNKRALQRIFTLTESMLSHYSKVFMVRIDLHPKEFSEDNKSFSLFLRNHIKKLVKQYDCKVGSFGAREQHTSDKQHYHLALLLNGSKVNHPSKLLKELSLAWETHCGGIAVLVKNSFYMMKRGDKSSIEPVIYRLSYLTKTFSKDKNKQANDYLSNQVKYKEDVYKNIDNDILLVNPQITLLYHQQVTDEMNLPFRHLNYKGKHKLSNIFQCELSKLFLCKYKFSLKSFTWINSSGLSLLTNQLYSLLDIPFYTNLKDRMQLNCNIIDSS